MGKNKDRLIRKQTTVICNDSEPLKVIAYTLIRSSRTTIQLAVLPGGSIEIRAPLFVSQEKIDEVITKREQWILDKVEDQKKHSPLPAGYSYASGETFLYLGQPYIIKVIDEASENEEKTSHKTAKTTISDQNSNILINDGYLIIRIAYTESSAMDRAHVVQKTIEKWQKRQAQIIFSALFEDCWRIFSDRYPLAEKPELHLRTMKTRWGSMSNPATGKSAFRRNPFSFLNFSTIRKSGTGNGRTVPRMTLNTLLVCADFNCIRQVVFHELCHLIHPNHSKTFYETLALFVPNWKESKERLEKTFCK